MNGCFTVCLEGARILPTSDAGAFRFVVFFFFPQDQGQRKDGNKSITFTVKKEGRERKGFETRCRWENMNILAKKGKQKGTEPLPEMALGLI